MNCHIVNPSPELSECRCAWVKNEEYACRCLEDVLYTQAAAVPQFQRLSIFVPMEYLNDAGEIQPEGRCGYYTAKTAPVIFANNAAGYMQMPHTWLGGPRCFAQDFLREGMIYVTCGCRGRESRNENGEPVGKAPATLIDFKTAIRFLRHNRACLPGNWDRIISTGWSAGGAMSALLGVSGDHPDYDSYLRANGAFMEESDAVFACQIYCPIIDLEHADQAYEWCFAADPECEDSPAGPAETMTPFKAALSAELMKQYIRYLNSQQLQNPENGELFSLEPDGRSGSFYRYLMGRLEKAAGKYLARLPEGEAERYLAGETPVMRPAPRKRKEPELHHAGQELALGEQSTPMTMGERLLRENAAGNPGAPEMIAVPGTDKRSWLSWDGQTACITGLDDYVRHHRRRMKPCTSFDTLPCNSGENHLFGNAKEDYVHFNPEIGTAVASIADRYPEEASAYLPGYQSCMNDTLAAMLHLMNPMDYIGDDAGKKASFFRIRVGASDADTSFSIAAVLALKLRNAWAASVDDAFVWDQPHCQADYPGELTQWIRAITAAEGR